MFDIRLDDDGRVLASGRLDANHAATAQAFLDGVAPPCIIDVAGLEYISSAGLGVLLKTHKRLVSAGAGLQLVNVNAHVNDVFRYSGMDKLFSVTLAGAGE